MAIRSLAVALACTSLFSLPAQAQDLESIPFPLTPKAVSLVDGTFDLEPVPGAFSALQDRSLVRMTGVALPGAGQVDLTLERSSFDPRTIGMYVNGQPQAYDPGDLTLWKGTVDGDLDSEVMLGFSRYGSYGWIKTGGEFHHLLAYAAPGNDWANAEARLVPDSVMQGLGAPDLPQCQAGSLQSMAQPPTSTDLDSTQLGVSSSALGTVLECKVAVETDYQYYQNWGNLTAAQNYTSILLGAISDRYQSQVDIVLTYPYLQFYTSNNDPWNSQGGGAGAVLDQFRNAWAGNIPNGAHLAHFISGANLGGGVAYLDALCSQNWGFGVSGNTTGGTQFPVQQSSNTWDFVVIAHELGHNVGTSHTHNYCPPLDQCASSANYGQCQNQRVCTSNGTIMSYCHTCSGGMNNITTFFHPTVVTHMRNDAQNSCLPPWTGGGCTSDAMEPNDSCGAAVSVTQGSYNGLNACAQDSDYFEIAVAPGEQLTLFLDFVDSAGNIDARLSSGDCFATYDTGTSTNNDETLTWTNTGATTENVVLEVYMGDATQQNGYDLDVTLVQTDPCVGAADDGLENNDSCVAAVSMGDGVQTGLFASKSDADFYSICVAAGETLNADIYFTHANGDLDMFLYDPSNCGGGSGTGLAQGFSASDDESITWTNTGSVNVSLVLEVSVWPDSPSNCNTYDLSLQGAQAQCNGGSSLGTLFCSPANVNSRTLSASIFATGSNVVSANNLTLTTSGLPLNQFGYYLCSQTEGLYIVPQGSMGLLCLSTNIGRFANQVASSGLFGEIVTPIDLTSMPTNPIEPVLAGQSWNFQLWYRDFFLQSTSNFSDGIRIQFQ